MDLNTSVWKCPEHTFNRQRGEMTAVNSSICIIQSGVLTICASLSVYISIPSPTAFAAPLGSCLHHSLARGKFVFFVFGSHKWLKCHRVTVVVVMLSGSGLGSDSTIYRWEHPMPTYVLMSSIQVISVCHKAKL